MESLFPSTCKQSEGQFTYINCKYQYSDPITDKCKAIVARAHHGSVKNYKQVTNNIQLPSIIAYLTQSCTYPFSNTTTQTAVHLPTTPLVSWLKRMCDSCKQYLLLKSLHYGYANKLQQQQPQNSTTINNKQYIRTEVKKDTSTHALLTAGSSSWLVQETAKPYNVLCDIINLNLITNKVAVNKAAPKTAAFEKLPDRLETNPILNVANEPLHATSADVLSVKAEITHLPVLTAVNDIMDDMEPQQQQPEAQQTLSENKQMSTKESIAKMSLNLSGTTDAGNGKTVNKRAALTPRTPKTPLEHSAIGSKATIATTPGKCEATKKDKPKSAASPGATVSFDTKTTPKTPPVTPDSPYTYIEDDMNSVYSFATTTSGRSTMSCEHPYVALNGTTFSGRKMKYVVHCSAHAGQIGPDYLTPTQRAQRQLRRLKEVLSQARQDLEQKDSEIVRLTREVVELRLFKASLSSPDERSASSDAITVREAELKTSQDVSPIIDMVDEAGHKTTNSSPRHLMHAAQQSPHSLMHSSTEMHSSCADSGNFEDMTSSSVHSKDDSYTGQTHDIACGSDEIAAAGKELAAARNVAENFELQRQELIRMYEQKIEELIRSQDAATSEVKRVHNDKMEALLMKLADCNTRYADIVPDYEHAKERIRELEAQLDNLQQKLADHEDKQKKMYLHMYQKGQEAERINRADQALEMAKRQPNSKVSVSELLLQLQNTQDELENIRASEQCRVECGNNHALLTAKEAISLWVVGARKTIYKRLLEAQKNRTHVDPEVTLQFLKSAVYYFLTDKENSQGHLQAIESILEFTEAEKQNISKARAMK